MADQKISQLPTITGANMATDDKFVLVDTSADATVATTRTEFFSNIPTITGNITSTGRVILTNAASSADTTNVSVGTLSGGFYANTPSGNAFYHAVAGNSITYNDAGLHWFKVSGTERLRVNSTGIVVAGTATSEGLTVNRTGAVKSTLSFANSGTTYGQIHFNNVPPYDFSVMQQFSTGSLVLGTNDTERMRINSSGNVGIGTNNPSNLLTLNRADNGIVAAFQKNGTTVGNISVVDAVTAYNTSSDYRLKTDAQPMTGATERVQELNPVNFEWLSNGTRVDGFLAHEAQEVVPESVTGERDAMRDEEYEVTPAVYEDVIIDAVEAVEATYDEDGLLLTEGTEGTPERTEQRLVTEAVITTRSVPDYQGIDQSKLVPLLTAALQEALTKIDSMEERLTALEE